MSYVMARLDLAIRLSKLGKKTLLIGDVCFHGIGDKKI